MAAGNGGALKHPARQSGEDSQDWCEAAGGSFIDLVIEGIFGVQIGLDGKVQVNSRLLPFDRTATLTDLMVGGKAHQVSLEGLRKRGNSLGKQNSGQKG
jgi:hypothetical protein